MTVGLVIVSHSAQLAAGVAELAGQMTQGKTPIVAAGGAADNVLGTSAEKILDAIQSLDSADGVLVLLDLGSAILSTEMALEMLSDEQRARTRLSYAPIVEGAVASALEASLGRTLAEVAQVAEKTASAAQLLQLKPFSQAEEPEQLPASPSLLPSPNAHEITLRLTNPAGLHLRPASLVVQTAAAFSSQILVQVQGTTRQTDATSMLGILSLNARKGDAITIRAQGEDAQAALAALSELVQANFHEAGPETPAAETAVQTKAPQAKAGAVAPPDSPRQPWKGVGTSAGSALGPAFLYKLESISLAAVKQQAIPAEQVATEQQRLRAAVGAARGELQHLKEQMQQRAGQAEAAIFEAQALLLADPQLLQSALQMIEEQQIDAASAIAAVGQQQATLLEEMDDALLAARAADVRDVTNRAIHRLASGTQPALANPLPSQPSIFLARDLTPSDTATLDPSLVLGICTVMGGPTSHAAIVARALGIPAMAGLHEAALQVIHTGEEVGLDADQSLLYHRPDQDVRAQLTRRSAERQQQQAALQTAAQQVHTPFVFQNRRIHFLANVGSEAEATAAGKWGAEGIGLLRTEFLFADAITLPNEEEQRQRYARIFRAFYAQARAKTSPIVVRTLDAGADKPLPALTAVLGDTRESNPALGVRGIRISLAHESLLEQQISALLLAAADTSANLHIMFPMITTVEELQRARTIVEQVYANLKKHQVAVPAHVPIGIMVEVPAAALMAPELAKLADFFSIGANDLLQYTLACDRTNAALSSLYHPMQPAVLRLIGQIAEAGRHAGKPVAVCGEIAGDARLAPFLVGLGVEELSMTPTSLPTIRAALAQWSHEELAAVARQISQLQTVAEVEHLYAAMQKKHGPTS